MTVEIVRKMEPGAGRADSFWTAAIPMSDGSILHATAYAVWQDEKGFFVEVGGAIERFEDDPDYGRISLMNNPRELNAEIDGDTYEDFLRGARAMAEQPRQYI